MIKVRKFAPLNSFLEYTISNQNMSSGLAFHASMILHYSLSSLLTVYLQIMEELEIETERERESAQSECKGR